MCSSHYNRWKRYGEPTSGDYFEAPLAQRFWAKVDKRGPDECWPWLGSRSNKGYGRIQSGGRSGSVVISSRVAWELANGPIPEGLFACHSCDNPPCCNAAHLFLGTPADNVADMIAKGRATHQKKAAARAA